MPQMPQEFFLFIVVPVVVGFLLWFLIAALRGSRTKAQLEIKPETESGGVQESDAGEKGEPPEESQAMTASEAERQLSSLTAELVTVQRDQQNLLLAQERAVAKLEGLRQRLVQAEQEVKQEELGRLMRKHLLLDVQIERQTEKLLELLQEAVASQERMKRLGQELNLRKDFSLSFEFLTGFVAWKLRSVFGQGLQLASNGRQQNVSELDNAFFYDAREELGTDGPEATGEPVSSSLESSDREANRSSDQVRLQSPATAPGNTSRS